MKTTFTPLEARLYDPDSFKDIDDLRVALREANGLIEMLMASTRNAKIGIDFLTDILSPVVGAHLCGDHDEVKRLLDAHIRACHANAVTHNPAGLH
ncbi:hypothetical protein [Paraburkholderia fungorum]|uniref:hypothetical protein n=1 Tax=Paraburkholderia fungorum TaxID=134537 RepID=UPI00402B9EE9